MRRSLVLVVLAAAVALAFPPPAQSQAGIVFVWGNAITDRSLGPGGGNLLVGPFRSFDSCIAFLALMQREGAGLGVINPGATVVDIVPAGGLFCVQLDARGNVLLQGQASTNSNEPADRGWLAGGINSQGYFFGIGPVRTRQSCSIILGAMHRDGAGFAYIGATRAITQAVLPSSLSCKSY